ncbi:hypothetical protein SK128_012925 [Halocaridina rubra]|uniref:Elongator complex protein 1 n=1 Tax=Halocaridina rubra TaxID=373956 RepID=A0AAN8X002_HALRR
MRNLKLCEYNRNSVTVSKPGCICIDISGSVYYVNIDGIETLKTSSEASHCLFGLSWDDHEVTSSEIIGADVLTASNSICVITRDGDVITVNIDTQEVEVVGSVAAGLEAACWSPDQEILVLVTGDGSAILMTSEFDPVCEFSIDQEDFGESKFVTVGWGKKETQFHGKEGKQAAKTVKKEVKPILEWDDRKPRISWHGDGQLFAISYVAQELQNRRFKTVTRDGVVQYTSEDIDGLEQALSWKPSGSLIASSQRLPNKHDIVFFEKNGLRHGEFTLPFAPNDMIVKDILWNQESSCLLVWLQPCSKQEKDYTVLQLWTTGNYHWYLKQELRFEEGVVYICWDMESPLVLHVLTPSHLYHYGWVVSTDISKGVGVLDLAQVAVIDGSFLKITPFRQCAVPPPMSAYEVGFEQSIQTVLYAPAAVEKCDVEPDSSVSVEDSGFLEVIDPPGSSSNNICIIHGDNILTFLVQAHANDNLDDFDSQVRITGSGGNGFNVKVKVHKAIAQHQIEWECDTKPKSLAMCQLYNWIWAEKNTLLACYTEEDQCFLVVISLQSLGSEAGRVFVKTVVPVEDSVVSMASSPDGIVAGLQLSTGALLKFSLQSQVLEPYLLHSKEVIFPSRCHQMSLCSLSGEIDFVPLGLTARNRLYMGNDQILSNCTSYHIHSDHLVVTTTNHMLRIVPLTAEAFQKVVEGKFESEGSAAGTRKVERGSRIVTAVPQDDRVVLQMPRGNLEVVCPRPLAIHFLKYLLDDHQYQAAVDLMRKHRIDLNLLYDHNPKDFKNHVIQFVQRVDNPHWLDLFLANLCETDVTETMYGFNYPDKVFQSSKDAQNKIDEICTLVRNAMVSIDEERYLLPILTSHIKMTQCQMDVALQKVKEMKDTKDKKFAVSADEGLRHLLYISDVNDLYNVALGTYDFNLVMMVAEKSQKDPKEYLPFLNELKQCEENYMKYKVNVHLRRFKMALECLKDDTEHEEECLNLIITEKLFKEALQIFPSSSAISKSVCEHYGNYLLSKKCYNEASIMYTRAESFVDALKAYQQAGNWKMALVIGTRLNFNNEKMNELCNTQVEMLKERREYADSATIYEEYLKNEEEAVDCLVKGCHWDDALRLAFKHNRPDLLETNIQPGALEQYDFYVGEVRRYSEEFTWYCERLTNVRRVKEQQLIDFLDGKGEAPLDSDLYSDTSTVTGFSYSKSCVSGYRTSSTASGRTYRSTKNKRKLERKKHSTKEGSAYEDLGLVTALHEIMCHVDQLAPQIMALMTVLMYFCMDDKAQYLQSSFAGLLALFAKHEREIWPTSVSSEENEPEFGPHLTTEGAVRLMKGMGTDKDVSLITQRMKNLQPHLQHAPLPSRSLHWELQIFKKEK